MIQFGYSQVDLSTPFHLKFRVKSILWGGSLLYVSRIRHILNNVNLSSMNIQLFQSLGTVVKEHFLHMDFSLSISFDFQTKN